MLHYSIYAFAPFGIIIAIILIATVIAQWPLPLRRPKPRTVSRPTAEILYFPTRRPVNPATATNTAAPRYVNASSSSRHSYK